jgi:hypothetical protein
MNKVISLADYRNEISEESLVENICLDALTINDVDALLLVVKNELISINSRLSLIRYNKKPIIKKQYSYFERAKNALLEAFNKVEQLHLHEKEITLSYFQLDCLIGAIESCFQDDMWKGMQNSDDYRNVLKLYEKTKPYYGSIKNSF